MSTYKSFAVAGTGLVGLPIIEALANRKASVVVLIRSSLKVHLPEGVQAVTVDYNDKKRTAEVLKQHGVQVVISTLNPEGLASQNKIAEASKEAGVQLFVPSEFGMPTQNASGGVLEMKDKSAEHINSIGLPTARFYTGFFTDRIPVLTGLPYNGKINVVGKGDRPVSFTSIKDVAGFVAHVLTNLPPSKLANSVYRLQGDRASMDEVGSILKVNIERVDRVPGPDSDASTYLQQMIANGMGSTGWDNKKGGEGVDEAGCTNYLWDGHHWKSIKEFFGS